MGDALGIVLQAVAGDIATDVFYIAREEVEGVGIEARVDGLGEIDDSDLALPVEYVVGREIGVYVVVGQAEFDVAHQLLEDGAHLARREFDVLEKRGWSLTVAQVLHEDGAATPGQRPGDVRAHL